MRKLFFYLMFLMPVLAQAGPVLYFVDVCRFENEGKPYVEVYISIEGNSVIYKEIEPGKFQANAELGLKIKSMAADSQIVYNKNILLNSPVISDTNSADRAAGFMEVRRIEIDPGDYIIFGELRDKHDPGNHVYGFERQMFIEDQSEKFHFSDVEFIQGIRPSSTPSVITKYGYDIYPLVTNGTYANMDSLSFYAEIYNSDIVTEGTYYVHAYITKANSKQQLSTYSKTLKKKGSPVEIVTASFDISNLSSQTYMLNIECFKQNPDSFGTVVFGKTSVKFFVYNTRTAIDFKVDPDAYDTFFGFNEEQLNQYIPLLRHISTQTEIEFAKAVKTFEEKKNFFYNFWMKRKADQDDSPSKPWNAYLTKIKYVNDHYKAQNKEGWETDRGRVMLVYGAPNNIDYHPGDPGYYPYEVWTYDRIGNQSAVKFVFYDRELGTGDYLLLHSDKFGEYNNPRWKVDLLNRVSNEGNLDRDQPIR